MQVPARGSTAGNDRAAFTLVELVICLAILATAAAIAVPRYAASLARYRAELAAKRIVNDLELVRNRARAQGTYESAYFYTSGDYYRMASDPALSDQVAAILLRQDRRAAGSGAAAAGSTFSAHAGADPWLQTRKVFVEYRRADEHQHNATDDLGTLADQLPQHTP